MKYEEIVLYLNKIINLQTMNQIRFYLSPLFKAILFAFSIIILAFPLVSQKVSFTNVMGKSGYDDVRSIIYMKDKNQVAITGLCKSENDAEGDVYLSYIDLNGNLLTSEYFGKQKEDGGNGIIRTSDGGILITGHTELPTTGIECDAMATKIGSDGKLEWQINLGGANDETSYHSIEMADGSFWIAGTNEDGLLNNKANSGIIFRVDAYGKFIETIIFPYEFHLGLLMPYRYYVHKRAHRVIQYDENSILVSGISPVIPRIENAYSGRSAASYLWLVNTDSSKLSKEILYNNYFNIKIHDLILDRQNERILLFGIHSFVDKKDSTYNSKPWIQVVNSKDFSINWYFKGPVFDFNLGSINEAKLDEFGRIFIVGDLIENGRTYAYWVMLNEKLEIVTWAKLDIENNASASCIALGENKDIFIGGRSWSSDEESQMFVSHITSISTSQNVESKNNLYNFNFIDQNHLIITTLNSVNSQSKYSLKLFDQNGKQIYFCSLQNISEQIISLDFVTSGLLYYQVMDETSVIQSGKLVKI